MPTTRGAGLGRAQADHRVPDPARRRGVRRRHHHLRSPALPLRADRDHGRAGRRQLGRVAERERAQAELARARDEAMEASRQKSEFLATMSHEIRTPLNGVIGLNDLLLRTALDPEQQRLAAGVEAASRTLLGLINDILDFSKIEAGRLELERLDFEVRPLLDQVANMLAEPARAKGLDLLVSCHPTSRGAVRRPDPAGAGGDQPGLERREVHRARRGARPGHRRAPRTAGSALASRSTDTGRRRSRGRSRRTSSSPSPRATPRRPASTAAPGSASPSRARSCEAMGGTLEYAAEPRRRQHLHLHRAARPRASSRPASSPDDAVARELLRGRRVAGRRRRAARPVLGEQLAWWGVECRPAWLDRGRARLDAARGRPRTTWC